MKLLTGWKEIAAHLRSGMRTVQRWESLGLPVHRTGQVHKGSVVAFGEEIDAWVATRPSRFSDQISELKEKVASLEAEVEVLKKELAAARSALPKPTRRANNERINFTDSSETRP